MNDNEKKLLDLCRERPDLIHDFAEIILLAQGYQLAPSTADLAEFLAREGARHGL